MKRTNYALLALCCLSLWVLSACQKDGKELPENNVNATLTTELSESDNVLFGAIADADDLFENVELYERGRTEGCAEVLHNRGSRTITIDFGQSCKGPFGRERKGKVSIEYTGILGRLTGRIITYTDYTTHEGHVLNGRIQISSLQLNSPQQISYTVSGTNVVVKLKNGNVIRISEMERRHAITLHPGQDAGLRITGAMSGTTNNNIRFSSTISNPLILTWQCMATGNFYPLQGVQDITLTNGTNVSVDWGTGACDKTVVIKIGNSITITKQLP